MKKYRVEFTYQDRNARGLHFKNSSRTVKAAAEQEAIEKINRTMATNIFNVKATEITD